VPIIALTAHALKGDRERFLQAGMNSYIPKPIRMSDFYTTIAEAIEGRPLIGAQEDREGVRR
jgi:CheY-like chemotaxis protein